MFLTTLVLTAAFTPDVAPPPRPAAGFYVYGGGCSRSIALQEKYATAEAAFAAAERYRTEKKMVYVGVRTGDHGRDHFGRNATEYKVYHKGLRCGQWQQPQTAATYADAEKLAAVWKGQGTAVEIVGHYAPK